MKQRLRLQLAACTKPCHATAVQSAPALVAGTVHSDMMHLCCERLAGFLFWMIVGMLTMTFLVLTVVFHKRIFSPIPVSAWAREHPHLRTTNGLFAFPAYPNWVDVPQPQQLPTCCWLPQLCP
jgi:hypothetical protein